MKFLSEEGRIHPCPRCQVPLVCDAGVVPAHGKRIGERLVPCDSPKSVGFTRTWGKKRSPRKEKKSK